MQETKTEDQKPKRQRRQPTHPGKKPPCACPFCWADYFGAPYPLPSERVR